MLGKGFFLTQSSNPVLPPEEWTLVQEITTDGAYSTTLGWGKYKIVISGAGGGGAAGVWTDDSHTRYAYSGANGEEYTKELNVLVNQSQTITGIIGAGGTGGKARTLGSGTNAGGTGGAGYSNGANGTNQQAMYLSESASVSGGGGGGSTSLEINSNTYVAKGGNGGTARYSNYGLWGPGGDGGSGGTSSGTGATGGTGVGVHDDHNHQHTGGTGADGYVRIYKSNLYPEPL